MQISGKQVGSLALLSFAAYEGCKLYTQGTSYTGITKIALSLIGTGALLYADWSSSKGKVSTKKGAANNRVANALKDIQERQNPPQEERLILRLISPKKFRHAKQFLQQFRSSDSTPQVIKDIFNEVEKKFEFSSQNFIPAYSNNNNIKFVMDKPIMWGISKVGNPYLCLLVNTSENQPKKIFILSEEKDNLRPKKSMENKCGFLHFSDIANNKFTAASLFDVILNGKTKAYQKVKEERRNYNLSLYSTWEIPHVEKEFRTLDLEYAKS